jgi:hypothetical protein
MLDAEREYDVRSKNRSRKIGKFALIDRAVTLAHDAYNDCPHQVSRHTRSSCFTRVTAACLQCAGKLSSRQHRDPIERGALPRTMPASRGKAKFLG